MGKLNEKRIELNNPYPVRKKEIIDLVERSSRLVHTATDDKTVQLYIYSNGSERPEAFAEVEITSVGYILHGAEGYDYQGSSMKEFEEDLRDVVFNFDATTSKRFGESNTINKENLFESLLNEAETTKYMACCYDPEDYYEETNYIDEDGELSCNSSGAKLFNTEDEAIEYADENKPIGWMSFAMPFNTTLKEGRVSLDDKIKIIERFKAYCIKYEVDAQPVGECSDGIYVYCNNPDDVKRIIKDWREKGFGAVSDGQKVNIYKKSSTILESDDTYKAKVNGKWLKGNKLVKDKKDADTFESKTEPTQRINQMKKDGKLNKNAKPNIIKESHIALFDDLLKEYLLEDIEDFPKNTRAMYRFARRRHDDTGAIRKVSKEPYWVHPEGVAKIVMEHGGSDLEIKAAMAHDVLEDTGESYEDMVEKFGEKVASIVKEVTNDKDEIAKVGKEKYISEELCRLSPEALTVKLADMLYNMKDSPTEKNYERMRKNIAFLMMNRQLSGKHLELAQEIMEV